MIPHTCPVCNGHCTVSRPRKACNGTGIIWEVEPIIRMSGEPT